MDVGHWVLCEDVTMTENVFGFIYEITNTATDKKYIGKKQCNSKIKRKPLKGRKRNRIDYKESDWKNYTGSSVDLNNDILKYGKDKFIFKILRICDSKWALAYYEIKEQLSRNVLIDDSYYNGIINVRIGRAPKAEIEKIKKENILFVNA